MQQKYWEIGCGEGGNLKPFANIGCQVFGVDMAQIRIEQACQFFSEEKLKGHFESGDFLEYPTPSEDDKFDIAILHDVIEHVPDKIAFLSHIRKFFKRRWHLVRGFSCMADAFWWTSANMSQ